MMKTQTSGFYAPRIHRLCHGGTLRQKKAGRKFRPLRPKEFLHVVFKSQKNIHLRTPHNSEIIMEVIEKYAKKFSIKIEHISIQKDHIHLLIGIAKRKLCHAYFRVVAGQIAQRLGVKKLWRYRPFSRVVRNELRDYQTVCNYIQLNEKEARQEIPYRKERLRGLTKEEWELLWS